MIMARTLLTISTWYAIFYALRYLPIGIYSILFNFGPFFTLIFGFIILKEKLPEIEIVNMTISFIGVTLVIYSSK